jgi:hypothetical protein
LPTKLPASEPPLGALDSLWALRSVKGHLSIQAEPSRARIIVVGSHRKRVGRGWSRIMHCREPRQLASLAVIGKTVCSRPAKSGRHWKDSLFAVRRSLTRHGVHRQQCKRHAVVAQPRPLQCDAAWYGRVGRLQIQHKIMFCSPGLIGLASG